MKQIEIDNIYRNIPPEEIPWNIETPPKELVDLVEGGSISPCKPSISAAVLATTRYISPVEGLTSRELTYPPPHTDCQMQCAEEGGHMHFSCC
jgi:hypothetical protein